MRRPSAVSTAVVLIAPGHTPDGFQRQDAMRESLGKAKAMVAAGQGNETETFADVNQGRQFSPRLKAIDYVSWFDPEGDINMRQTAPRLKGIPALVISPSEDPLFPRLRALVYDRLPPDPRDAYVEIHSDHFRAPVDGAEAIVGWIKERAGFAK